MKPLSFLTAVTLIHLTLSQPAAASDETGSGQQKNLFQRLGSALAAGAQPTEVETAESPEVRKRTTANARPRTSSGGGNPFSFLFRESSSESPARAPEPLLMTVRTTAYSTAGGGTRSAISTPLRASQEYTSAASDWSRFPLGTRFRIAGNPTVYVIDDYGSALVGTDTIDLYFPSRSQVNQWGVRNVQIEILEAGCFQKSLSILKGRQGTGYCRRMCHALMRHDPKVHPLAVLMQ